METIAKLPKFALQFIGGCVIGYQATKCIAQYVSPPNKSYAVVRFYSRDIRDTEIKAQLLSLAEFSASQPGCHLSRVVCNEDFSKADTLNYAVIDRQVPVHEVGYPQLMNRLKYSADTFPRNVRRRVVNFLFYLYLNIAGGRMKNITHLRYAH